MKHKSLLRTSFWFVAFCCVISLFIAFASGEIAFSFDAVVFTPPMLSYATQGELLNEVWPPAPALNPDGTKHMTSHGLLYPMFIGSVFLPTSYHELYPIFAAFRAGAFLLFAVVLFIFGRECLGRWIFPVLLSSLLLASFSGTGRPEDVTTPLCLLLLLSLVVVWEMPMSRWLVGGIGIGLLGSLSPVAGFLTGIVVAAFLAREKLWWLDATAMACLALGLFLLFFSWYPVSFGRWLYGFQQASEVATSVGAKGSLTSPSRYLAGAIVLAGLSVLPSFQSRYQSWISTILLGLALGGLFYFSCWKPRHYNTVTFVGPILLLMVCFGRGWVPKAFWLSLGACGTALLTCLLLSLAITPRVEKDLQQFSEQNAEFPFYYDYRATFIAPRLAQIDDKQSEAGLYLYIDRYMEKTLGDQILYQSRPHFLGKLFTGHGVVLLKRKAQTKEENT